MNEKSLRILFAAWLFALAACACPNPAPVSTAAPPGAAPDSGQQPIAADTCKRSPCVIRVAVSAAGAGCTLKAVPEALIIAEHHHARIEWRFADDVPERFRFVELRFKDEDPEYLKTYGSRIPTPSRDQFHDKRVTPRQVDVVDDNTVTGVWSYGFSVTDGTSSCRVDPPIINDY